MPLSRRHFLFAASSFSFAKTNLSSRERVDFALKGQDVDRPPISLWHHFGLESQGSAKHAEATVAFHRNYGTDLVKVMSDFPYPKPASGKWWELRGESNPFAPQIQALEKIRSALGGSAHFVETIFSNWTVAEKLSSKDEVKRLKAEQPQKLLDALEVIAKSQANHARRALSAGASGIFYAIAHADKSVATMEEYKKFGEPFDRITLNAVRSAKLNVLHLHGNGVYLDNFVAGWPAALINYSVKGTGVPIADLRKKYAGVLMGGIDEAGYRTLSVDQLRAQSELARSQAGKKFILAPGCSVPNDAAPAELARLKSLFS